MNGTTLRQRRRGRRRSAATLTVLVALIAGGIGVEAGAAAQVSSDRQHARELLASGRPASAVALDRRLADDTGFQYALAAGQIAGAAGDAQQALLGWCYQLARAGDTGQALSLLDQVTGTGLRSAVDDERDVLVLQLATTAARTGDAVLALTEVNEVLATPATTALGAEATAAASTDAVAAARQLLAAHDPDGAVALLNNVVAGSTGADAAAITASARSELPVALLASASAAGASGWYGRERTLLQQLVGSYPGSAAATTASRLLAAPQSVVGTLIHAGGAPLYTAVRLAFSYRLADGGFTSNGPYALATVAANGTFTIHDVPLGGPYMLQLELNGRWTALINPATGGLFDPVVVAAVTPTDLSYVILEGS